MKIRQANLSDASSLKELSKHVITACYTGFMGEEMVNGYLSSGASDDEVDKHISNTFVAVDDSELIMGYVVVIDDLIHIMMVSPEQQRLGIGARLLSFAETIIHNDNLKPTLETFEANTQAMNFYLKNGWLIARKKSDPDFGFVRVFFDKES
ncbi:MULTISPECIES: GNAT family N-acetyltransferase [unclassified Agarivorans]|uniref:GNAT family N-acetyltransferase n=1 Tax=unclassified Agarivorans TaxID=2636026 RepID=UPI0026E16FF9|nr:MULTISPECIES: GNAT family N-acetyltransferase [unclassified Agarivorans]MDO6684468.1 GNAT family N-acetyltransferase [Agarivorans sp. 3_MG-2023]MDO6714633.1 GNAT family N-acetyltransferase [Agarivorans sp. 2_MG-2023]